MVNPNDIKIVVPHSLYKEECDGILHYETMRLRDIKEKSDKLVKYILVCDKCGEEIILDYDNSYQAIIY